MGTPNRPRHYRGPRTAAFHPRFLVNVHGDDIVTVSTETWKFPRRPDDGLAGHGLGLGRI